MSATTTKREQFINKHLAEVEDQLGIPSGTTEPHLNPLQLAISYEFERNNPLVDYKDRGLDRCIKNRVNFTSETNSLRNLVARLFSHVKCPACRKTMKLGNSGGSADSQTYAFGCDCGCFMTLKLDNDAIGVNFRENKS